MELLVYTALFAPLFGSLFAALLGDQKKYIMTGIITSIMLAFSAVASIVLFVHTWEGAVISVRFADWIKAGSLYIPYGFIVDQISATMMVVVSFVSTMIHVYSIGYMEHEKGFNRYFASLSGFVFSMMVLVMSDNFAGLFIGWEGVGLCSWLLIGHWYHKHSASWAANEAFIMNRIADLGMLIGIFLIYWNFGTLQYEDVFSEVGNASNSLLVWIGIFLFIGAMGKSAQFPFHTWLADAMEGPTPVSALIHAATMVTAGVFLVIRAHELFMQIPEIGLWIATLGAFVAFFAASMALVNSDLKRIIAYSTLSQLGYMFVAVGVGAYWIALFHLMTHAFFKSLLFLGAGNVMHAMHDELNIRKMGRLYEPMKVTAIMMILASLALGGFPFFSGFFSKDKILEAAFTEGFDGIWLVLWITAGMTAFYGFRLIMLVFFSQKNHQQNPHEAHKYMLFAMAPLTILAVVSGWFEGGFHHYALQLFPQSDTIVNHVTHRTLMALAILMGLSGMGYAIYQYSRGGFDPKWEKTFLYRLLHNQYYIPQLYARIFIRPYAYISRVAWKHIDTCVIDFTVDLIAKTVYRMGQKAQPMQSGNISKMLRWMVFGLIVLLFTGILYGF
jgi:NADH-quinone oxidoreductase subunit L